jgi:hypothetical protein
MCFTSSRYVAMKNTGCWNAKLHCLVFCRRFGEHTAFIYRTEDTIRGSGFLQNVCKDQTTWRHITESSILHSRHFENFGGKMEQISFCDLYGQFLGVSVYIGHFGWVCCVLEYIRQNSKTFVSDLSKFKQFFPRCPW